MNIMTELRSMVNDWYKYMNTSIPKGVNGKLFTNIMYSNRSRIVSLQDKYTELDSRVIENEALRQFFKKTDEEIHKDCERYGVEPRWNNYKMTSNTSSENTSKL